MSERQKQINFLKMLIGLEHSEQCRNLQHRIKRAEQDEKCIRRMMFLVVVVELLSLAGLGYSAVFHPNFFAATKPFLVRFFSALGLGSLICLLSFIGYWLWHRSTLNNLNEECRRTVLATLPGHSPASLSANHTPQIINSLRTSRSESQTNNASVCSCPETEALRHA